MEIMNKGFTVPKWVLVNRLKILLIIEGYPDRLIMRFMVKPYILLKNFLWIFSNFYKDKHGHWKKYLMKVSQQPQKPLSVSNQIWAMTLGKKDTATSELLGLIATAMYVATRHLHLKARKAGFLKPVQNKKDQKNLGYPRKKQPFYEEKDCFFLGYPKFFWPFLF